MEMFLVLVSLSLVVGAPTEQECCASKVVGGISYRFVMEQSVSGLPSDCLTNCVYEREEGEDGTQYCFGRGDLEVHCGNTTEGGVTADCTCGLAQRTTRIVGGVKTEVNEYPWQIGIVTKGSSSPWCGGSLVSDRWIVTAAHCVIGESASGLQVLLGEHDLTTTSETTMVKKNIAEIIMHPKYNDDTSDYDIALLKMKDAVDFSANSHIRTICLPEDKTNKYNGYIATVTGWGRLESGGAQPDELQEVDVKVMTTESCQNDYAYAPSQITNQMMCAAEENGVGGKDSCQGDSGGPLITKESSSDGITAGQNYELIGVVSWGYGCAEASAPGVYARVTNYLEWISKNTQGTWSTCSRT